MNNTYYYFLIILFMFTGSHDEVFCQDFKWEALEQPKKERIIIDTLEYVETIFDLEEMELFEFAFLDSDSAGNLVAYDFGREKIIYLPVNNYSNIFEISDGRGRGPRELGHVFDIRFDHSGSIWVADLEKSEISNWDSYGNLISSFKSKKKYVRPAKIALCKEEIIFVLSEQYIPDGIYHSFNFKGENISIFKQIKHDDRVLQSNMRGGSYSDGRLACHNSQLIHVGSFKNYIRRYNVDGDLIYSVKSISQDNPEPLLVREGSWTQLNEDAVRLHRDIDISNGLLYVGYAGKKGLWMYVLDVYDPKTAEYLYSFKFKNPVEEFTISKDLIFVTEFDWEEKDTDLAIYRIPEINE